MSYSSVAIIPRPAGKQYDALTQAIHWLTLFVIAVAFVAGIAMEEMPRGPAKMQLVNLHASFGVLLIALTAFRLLWRATVPGIEPTPGPRLLRIGAKILHGTLYLVLCALPIVGLLMMASKGRAVEVFGIFTLPPLIAPNRAMGHSLGELHEFLAYLTISLIGLHAAAALLHQFVLKDGGLARMLPFMQKTRT
jgi:cytochrome b561